MELKTGIIVKVVKYRESGKIVHILSSDGLDSYLVRGASNLKSKNNSYSQLLTLVAFDSKNSKSNSGFKTLTVGNVVNNYTNCKLDVKRLSSAIIVLELAYQFANHITDSQLFFDFTSQILELINNSQSYNIYQIIYKLKLLYLLGVGPNFNQCVVCKSKDDLVGFDISSGGMKCVNCATNSESLYDRKTIDVIKTLYLAKMSNLTDQSLEKFIDVASDIERFTHLYYQQYLGFSSEAEKVIKKMFEHS